QNTIQVVSTAESDSDRSEMDRASRGLTRAELRPRAHFLHRDAVHPTLEASTIDSMRLLNESVSRDFSDGVNRALCHRREPIPTQNRLGRLPGARSRCHRRSAHRIRAVAVAVAVAVLQAKSSCAHVSKTSRQKLRQAKARLLSASIASAVSHRASGVTAPA